MTRKRFIKLIMASGYSRNTAMELADWGRRCGKSYEDTYKAIPYAVLVSSAVVQALASIRPAVGAACAVIGNAFNRIAESLRCTEDE